MSSYDITIETENGEKYARIDYDYVVGSGTYIVNSDGSWSGIDCWLDGCWEEFEGVVTDNHTPYFISAAYDLLSFG